MSPIAEAFDEVRRFHVYDHDRDKWAMSGASFPGKGCVVSHVENRGIDQFSNPELLVEGQDSLTLVWEDGPDSDLRTEAVDIETSEVAARAVIEDLAYRLSVDPDRLKVVSIEAPNIVRYFLIAPDDFVGGNNLINLSDDFTREELVHAIDILCNVNATNWPKGRLVQALISAIEDGAFDRSDIESVVRGMEK